MADKLTKDLAEALVRANADDPYSDSVERFLIANPGARGYEAGRLLRQLGELGYKVVPAGGTP